MEAHLKILGWLYLLSGVFFLAIALLTGVALTGSGLLAGDWGAFAFLSGLGIFLSLFLLMLGLPGLLEGWGLLSHKSWARPLGFVLAVLNLFNFPFGTALGAYTIWVLLQSETEVLLKRSALHP